jgi:hypothetical protein
VRKLRVAIWVVTAAATVLATASPPASQAAASTAPSCVQPAQPAWIDYADKWVPFRRLFFRPGLAVTLAHTAPAADARSRGAQVAYWDMSLKSAVGTPSHPVDSSTIAQAAARLAAAAVKVTACDTPIVALNEIYGSRLRSPWSRTNGRYRANVLGLVRALAERGVQPHVLISEGAATEGAAGSWWRSVAEAATIVREVYVSGPALQALRPSGATIYLRFQLRRAVRNFTTIGIPSSRVGLALGFHSGRGGRAGLSAERWFGVVKREGLAARQVAAELGLDSVWSWGWASFPGASRDPAKVDAACVYLWARDPSLCDAPTAAGRGFDSSRAQPAEQAGRGNARLRALSKRHPVWLEVSAAAKLTWRVAYVQQRTAGGWTSLQRVNLAPFHPLRMRVPLPSGAHVLRLYVAAESAPRGAAFSTPPLTVRVH